MSTTTSPAAAASTAYCQQHGLEIYLQDAAQLHACSSQQQDPAAFLAEYLTAVACGKHVVCRDYAYVSGTLHNRKCFLLAAAATSAQRDMPEPQRLSLGDVHSLLQLLCPDLPASVVKNAWSSATTIQEWVDYQATKQQQQQQTVPAPSAQPPSATDDDGQQLVQLPIVWQCLETTFFYEHCLLMIRREAFDKNKRCISLDKLEAAMQRASSILPQHGWPVPPARCWKLAVAQASRAATHPDFLFRDLVRALCCCQELVRTVRRELQDAAVAAAATSAALAAGSASRTVTDDGTG